MTSDLHKQIERLQLTIATLNEALTITSQGNARLTAELAESKKQIGSYKTLTKALEEQVSHHRRLSERYQESIKTMQSERDANAILTDELTDTRDLAEHWAILAEQRWVELGECRKDAERYQYLRNIERRECLDLTGPEAGVWCDAENEMGELLLLTEDDLDAAIDAAVGVKP